MIQEPLMLHCKKLKKLNEFDTGKSFEELALEYSEDGGTKDIGGSLGITDGTLLPPGI